VKEIAAELPLQTEAGIVNVDVGGATTVTACVTVPGEHKPEVGVTVKVTLYVPGVFQVVDAVVVPVPVDGVPEANVQAPVPVTPPVYVSVAGCPAQTTVGILKAALAAPPIDTSNVSYNTRLLH
jgi:hypothetical protein